MFEPDQSPQLASKNKTASTSTTSTTASTAPVASTRTTLDDPVATDADADDEDAYCESDKVLVVEKLLKFGANPDAADLEGQTPLHVAIRGGHAVVAKRLLQAGADPNLCDKKVSNLTSCVIKTQNRNIIIEFKYSW